MPLFGPPNVEKLKAKGDVSGLIKALVYKKDAAVRKEAAHALQEVSGEQAVEPLIAALGDEEGGVREIVARALAEIGDPRAVDPLAAALDDEQQAVRQTALNALAQIGGVRATESLVAALKAESQPVRDGAANALVEIGAPAVEPLVAALKAESWRVRGAAARALVEIGTPAVEPLVAALQDPEARPAAIKALGEIGDARALEPLLAVMKEGDRRLRKDTAAVLDKLGWQPDESVAGAAYWVVKREWDKCVEIGTPAVEPLVAALADGDEDVREAASKALAKIGEPAVEPLVAALKHEHWSAREAAANALGGIADARALEPLVETLQDESRSVRWSAARALGKIGDAWAVKPLIAALKDEDSDVRRGAAGALGKIGDARAVKPLIAALTREGQKWTVRSDAAKALGEMGDEQAVEPLVAALRDERQYVRTSAAESLGKLGDRRAVEPLIATLEDEESWVAMHAIKALGEIGDAQAVEPLITLLKHDSWQVRGDAARALGRIGDRRAVEPLIAALKDEDSSVRGAAEWALKEIGWQPDESQAAAVYVSKREWDKCVELGAAAVGALVSALSDASADVREAAAATLDQLGWQPDESKAGAAYWVAKHDWDKCADIGAPAVEPLVSALKDDDVDVRRGAASALGQIGDARAIEPLLSALRSGSDGVRRAAAEALDKIHAQVSPELRVERARAISLSDVVNGRWSDPHPDAPITAAFAVIEQHGKWISEEDVSKCLPEVRRLAKMKDPVAAEVLCYAALMANHYEVRIPAAQALKETADPTITQVLCEGLTYDRAADSPVSVRHVLRTLETIGDANARSAIADFLDDFRTTWSMKGSTVAGGTDMFTLGAYLDGEKSICLAACEALASFGGARAAVAIEAVLADSYWNEYREIREPLPKLIAKAQRKA
jgi:HEAT repeat protein